MCQWNGPSHDKPVENLFGKNGDNNGSNNKSNKTKKKNNLKWNDNGFIVHGHRCWALEIRGLSIFSLLLCFPLFLATHIAWLCACVMLSVGVVLYVNEFVKCDNDRNVHILRRFLDNWHWSLCEDLRAFTSEVWLSSPTCWIVEFIAIRNWFFANAQ